MSPIPIAVKYIISTISGLMTAIRTRNYLQKSEYVKDIMKSEENVENNQKHEE